MMRSSYVIAWLLLATLSVSPSASGQIWTEVDDAGDLPGTAQRTRGTGLLDFIQGCTSPSDIVDVYCIEIDDPSSFSAWTDESNGGSAEFNTMLWLFNGDGVGVLANDDNPAMVPFHSGMTPPSDDSLTPVAMDGPGVYYLAVSRFHYAPYSPAGQIFQQATSDEVSGPDGPGGDLPISHWSEQGIGGSAPTGAYSIRMTGAKACPPCSSGLTFWSTVGTGVGGAIFALQAYDDGSGNHLFAGGNFAQAGGVTVNNVAAWNGTVWSSLANGVMGVVTAMNTFAGELWVGGDFVIGQPIPQQVDIARWDGAQWRTIINQGSNHLVGRRVGTATTRVSALHVLEVPGAVLPGICNDPGGPLQYVGGEFDVFDRQIAGDFPLGRNLAVYTGNDWCDVGGAEFDGAVKAMAGFDDGTGTSLYVGGSFTNISDALTNDRFSPIDVFGIARWDGQSWSAVGTGLGPTGQNPPTTVFALAKYFDDNSGGPILVAAGSFETAGGVPAMGIAKWNGSTWNALGGGIPTQYLPATPFTLHIFDDDNRGPDLYVGGVFTINGAIRPGVLKWDSTQWSEVGLGINGSVFTMTSAEVGDRTAVYMGGAFTDAGGQVVSNIARWGSSYGGDVHWVSNSSGSWNEPVRWSINPQVPSTSDDVCIDRFQSNPTVTHSSGDTQIRSLYSSEQLVIEGGTFGVAEPSETWSLELHGGAIVGSSELLSRGLFVWTDGDIGFGAEGPVTVIAADKLTMSGPGSKDIDGNLEIRGQATWTGRGEALATGRAAITIAPGASLSIETDANLNQSSLTTPIINNLGTVTKIVGVDDETPDNTTDIYAEYNNTGTTLVQSGALILRLGGTHTGGFQVRSGALLGLGAPVGYEHHFQIGSSLTGNGDVLFGSGITRIAPGVTYAVAGTTEIIQDSSVQFDDLGSTTFGLDHSNGNLAGVGMLTVTGPAIWSGGWIGREMQGPVTVVIDDVLSIELGAQKLVDGILEIHGDATMNHGLTATGRGVLRTTSTATFAIQGDHNIDGSVFQYGSLGLFDNAGTLTKVAGILGGLTEINMVFQNTGTVRIDSGSLRFMDTFRQTGGVTVLNGGVLRVEFSPLELLGGTLTGSGMILGNVLNAAWVSPGLPLGRLQVSGDYTQTPDGAFQVQIGGTPSCTGADELTITGHASLAGTLEINIVDNCQPALGQSFTIMNYATHDGAFNVLDNRCAGPGLVFDVRYTDVSVTLVVIEQSAPDGDIDFNGVVDLKDMALFQQCFNGQTGVLVACCEPADLNTDTLIDLAGFASFVSLATGP